MPEDNGDPLNPANAAYRPELPDGAELIAQERERQAQRWTAESDDRHVHGELTACAVYVAGGVVVEMPHIDPTTHEPWPVERAEYVREKYGPDHIRRLVIAGALIAAEIDRLLRQQQ